MPSSTLKNIIENAKINPFSTEINLNGGINHPARKSKNVVSDLLWLNEQLWHLPKIQCIDLRKNKLEDKLITPLISIAINHPNIVSIKIDENDSNSSKIEDLKDKLAKNKWEAIKPEKSSFEKTALEEWVIRKAVHAIYGNRHDELTSIFSIEPSHSAALRNTLAAYSERLDILQHDQERVINISTSLIDAHPDKKPPLQFRSSEKMSTQWLVPTKIRVLQANYQEKASLISSDLTPRQTKHNSDQGKTTNALSEKINNLRTFISTRFNLTNNEVVELNKYLKENASCFLLNPNEILSHPCEAYRLRPLKLAFKANSLKSFNALLTDLGADPFFQEETERDIFTDIYRANSSTKKSYLEAIITHVGNKQENINIEFIYPGAHAPEYMQAQIDKLTGMYITLLNYIAGNYKKRINEASLLLWPFIFGKETVRKYRGVSTYNRTIEIGIFIRLLRQALQGSTSIKETIKTFTQQLEKCNAGIIRRKQPKHYLTWLEKDLQELSASLNSSNSDKAVADKIKTQLEVERDELREAQQKQEADSDALRMNSTALRANSNVLRAENTAIKAESNAKDNQINAMQALLQKFTTTMGEHSQGNYAQLQEEALGFLRQSDSPSNKIQKTKIATYANIPEKINKNKPLPPENDLDQATSSKARGASSTENQVDKNDGVPYYNDKSINQLLGHYLKKKTSVKLLSAQLRANWDKKNSLSHVINAFNMQRKQQISEKKPVQNKIIVPIELNQHHWALLYIIYLEEKTCIFYVNPLGQQALPEKLNAALKQIFPQAQVKAMGDTLTNNIQESATWIIVAAQTIAEKGEPPKKSHNIKKAYNEHTAVISAIGTGVDASQNQAPKISQLIVGTATTMKNRFFTSLTNRESLPTSKDTEASCEMQL